MSIRGIDTQMMINRLPDNARDASNSLKRPEVVQDFLGAQSRINDAQEQSKVTKMYESDMEQIRTDVDGGGGGNEGGGPAHDGKNKDEAESDLFVPSDKHIIDITI